MNWKTQLATTLAISVVLWIGTGCGLKPTDSPETKQSNSTEGTPSLPTKKSSGSERPPVKQITPKTKVSAEELAREFKTDRETATATYVDKTFIVEGKLKDIKVAGKDIHVNFDDQMGEGGQHIAYAMKGYLKMSPFGFSRGQKIRLEVRCVEATPGTVSFVDCAISGADSDPTPVTSSRTLIAAYRTDADGDAKYKGKFVRVDTAEVEKLPQDGVFILVPTSRIPGSKPPARKIRVEYDPSYKTLFPQMQEGGLVSFSGRCEGVSAGEIVIKDAWFSYTPVPK